MNSYIAGQLVEVTGSFTNTSGAWDPVTVQLKVGRKFTADTTYTYGTGSVITKLAVGSYLGTLYTNGWPQAQYTYEWTGTDSTGAVVSVGTGVFVVTTAPLT